MCSYQTTVLLSVLYSTLAETVAVTEAITVAVKMSAVERNYDYTIESRKLQISLIPATSFGHCFSTRSQSRSLMSCC